MNLGNSSTAPVLEANGKQYHASDVLDAAWFRGELPAAWLDLQAGLEAVRGAADFEPDGDALQALAEEVRYRFDLITAEATEAWLAARGLSLEDLTDYCHRRYWRQNPGPRPADAGTGYANATPEARELLRKDLMLAGEFDELARALAWRVSAAVADEPGSPLPPASLEAERARFLQRTGLAENNLRDSLQCLGRDEAWLGLQTEREVRFHTACDQACAAEARARRLAALRLPLTRLEVELLDLESDDAMREACLCVEADGQSLEAIAEQEHYQIERRSILLEELPEVHQQRMLGAQSGRVFPLIEDDTRFSVCVVMRKTDPTLADAQVLARVDAGLIATHFDNLAAKHIVWLTGPEPTT